MYQLISCLESKSTRFETEDHPFGHRPREGNAPKIEQIYMRAAVKVMPTISLC